MSKVAAFPSAPKTNAEAPEALSATVVDVIKKLVAGLSQEDRAKLLQELAAPVHSVPPRTGGELLGAIVRLLPKQKEHTVESIKRHVEREGIEAKPKAVYNAIGYLARRGCVKRVGYGRYIVDGMYIEATEEFGDHSSLRTDDSFCLTREES